MFLRKRKNSDAATESEEKNLQAKCDNEIISFSESEPEQEDKEEEDKKEEEQIKEEEESKKFADVITGALEERLERGNDDGEIEVNEIEKEALLEAAGILADAFETGEFTDALYDLLYRAATYEGAVEAARKAGELAGRNAGIEELLDSNFDSDGLPHPGATQTASPLAPSIFRLARDAR